MDAEGRTPVASSVRRGGATPWLGLALAGLLTALLGACDWGMPTANTDELMLAPAGVWPDALGMGTSAELAVEITVPDGASVTAAPVRWTSSDTSVLRVTAAPPAAGANRRDSLAVRLRATVTGMGRGSAQITVEVDSLAGFTAPRFQHAISVRERWIDVSAGGAFTCGVNAQLQAYCWGSGALGALGNGGLGGAHDSPQPVAGDLEFTTVDAGWDHACGRSTDGLVHCWGLNSLGELGTGNTLSQFVPTRVALGRAFGAVDAGNGVTCATLDAVARDAPSQGMWALCWGDNAQGQLGAGLASATLSIPDPQQRVRTLSSGGGPEAVPTDLTFASVRAGGGFACGIADTAAGGGAWCWGDDALGQLGNGNADGGAASPWAVAVAGPTLTAVVTSLASAGSGEPDAGGRAHACGLTSSGVAWCWGANDHGQLGTGTAGSAESAPVTVAGGRSFTQLSLGEGHSCGLDSSGTVYCWGRNDFGQAGTGQAGGSVAEPTAVSSESRFAKVSAGAFHTCALTVPEDGGALYCWGRNGASQGRDGGQLGNGTFQDSPTPTRVIESAATGSTPGGP